MGTEGRLLVAGDDGNCRAEFCGRLAAAGYSVDVADGPPAALEKLAGGGYDLLLLAGAACGLSVVETLRRRWSSAELPVIVVGGAEQLAGAAAALRSGADDWIGDTLPFTVALARIEAQLRMHALHRASRRATAHSPRPVRRESASPVPRGAADLCDNDARKAAPGPAKL